MRLHFSIAALVAANALTAQTTTIDVTLIDPNDGTVYCGAASVQIITPPPPPPPPELSTITANGRQYCESTADGTVYCWGSNQFGHLDPLLSRRATVTEFGTSISASGCASQNSSGKSP